MNDKPDPWAQWRNMSRRKKIFVYGSLGFCVFMVLVTIILPSPALSPEELAAQQKIEKEARAKDVNTFQESLGIAMSQCDSAGQRLLKKFGAVENGTGDVLPAYQEARFTYDACGQNSLDVRDVVIPDSFQDDLEEAADDAIEKCSTAMIAKRLLAESASTILDGDTSPSAITDLQESSDYTGLTITECSTAILNVSAASGVKLTD